ncbi:hypothetical protein ACL00X_20275, partial [Aeromonas diversa]|uniref:hypothetical protein n=1 Tax=Aeromonas diversa TaxID=502790 RepID=UPI0039A3B9FB
ARDQSQPVTDADLDAARASIRDQRGEIREYLDGEGVDVSGWGADSYGPVPDADRESANSD